MLIFIFIVIIFFVTFKLLSRKFSNPYLLTYIFGLKGAGKSTFMVRLMLRDLRKGWNVYTNMSDVVIPGVRIFKVTDLSRCVPEPHSSIYIDEAGLIWDNRDFAKFDKGYVEFFKLQRKYHNKVTINSQSFDVDKKIRDLVDDMYLLSSVGGFLGVARPLMRTIKVLEAEGNSESRLALNLKFKGLFSCVFFLMPFYWSYFDSFKAPERPFVRFSEIPGKLPSRFFLLRLLNKRLKK